MENERKRNKKGSEYISRYADVQLLNMIEEDKLYIRRILGKKYTIHFKRTE